MLKCPHCEKYVCLENEKLIKYVQKEETHKYIYWTIEMIYKLKDKGNPIDWGYSKNERILSIVLKN